MNLKIVIIPGLTLPEVSAADLSRIQVAGHTDDVVVTTLTGKEILDLR